MLRAVLAYRLGYARGTQVAATVGQTLAFALGLLGLFGNPMLLFIAVFVYLGAASESHAVQMRQVSKGMITSDAMIRHFQALPPSAHVKHAVQLLLETTQHEFPVVDEAGHLRGVLTRDDIIKALRERGSDTPVLEIMRSDIPVVRDRQCLFDALRALQEQQLPAIGVTNAAGRFVGLITPENMGELMMIMAATPRGSRSWKWKIGDSPRYLTSTGLETDQCGTGGAPSAYELRATTLDRVRSVELSGGFAMDDNTLRQMVIDELEFEPSLDAAHIGVAAENGVVTLTGHVASYAERISAEEAVRRVRGVKAIAQEIEVRYPFAKKTADDQIAKRAVDILEWDASVPRKRCERVGSRCSATWTGLPKASSRTAVRKLSGVVGVANNIAIKPPVQTGDVKKRIEEAFKRNAELEADAIRVSVLDGKVTLEGKVKAWYERYAAEQAAWSAQGVRSVDDRIKVS